VDNAQMDQIQDAQHAMNVPAAQQMQLKLT